jgi:hypothetical protein
MSFSACEVFEVVYIELRTSFDVWCLAVKNGITPPKKAGDDSNTTIESLPMSAV